MLHKLSERWIWMNANISCLFFLPFFCTDWREKIFPFSEQLNHLNRRGNFAHFNFNIQPSLVAVVDFVATVDLYLLIGRKNGCAEKLHQKSSAGLKKDTSHRRTTTTTTIENGSKSINHWIFMNWIGALNRAAKFDFCHRPRLRHRSMWEVY